MTKPDRRQAKSGFKGVAKVEPNDTPEPTQFELIPAPAFAPAWPASDTLPAETLARLLTGERLTQPAFGTSRWRLAAYVMELKYLGWPVKSAPVHYPGRARPIAQYWLDNKTIMAARALRGAA
ncbi:hypothetical protein [Burkholderia sp. ABCPW 111]|uniref:hypothetical protein n=1 Tax=Burkholderia sp. ABCPW 111 TaxID=1820025 RepID=UPI0005320306|nr:hypothetical protein [Burkholderia sp. ABCPW 111]KGS08647.1 hypothetical protein X946_212 [Burkholderia sp. ABCPW 111]